MPEFQLGNKTLILRPTDVVGKGGEADVYLKGSEAYKIFKLPTHPDLAGSPGEQQAAKERLDEHQKKLLAFPKNLPSHVVVPEELVRDKRGLVAGYRMRFLDNAEVLLRYGERSFRDQGIDDQNVVKILADLHRTVSGLHQRRVVIGDFNDLNVLVRGTEAFIIDADSMQFGNFPARMFTAKFVDPLLCDPSASNVRMARPHTSDSDWYAFLVMLMQSLLFVGPYGGVYRPKDHKKQVPHDVRPLKRITVFNPEVRYPRPARPYSILPDTLLHYFEEVFEKDKRGVPPLPLIEGLRFTTCSQCGMLHMRHACPSCVGATPVVVKEVHTGKVHAEKVFEADGVILYASMQGGVLRYLYHEGGAYKREGGKVVVEGPLESNIRFRIKGEDSLLARNGSCLVFSQRGVETITVDSLGLLPLVDANEDSIFFASGGALQRTGDLGVLYPERIGDILAGQTLFWSGETLGFGFYRAAELSNFFVFRGAHRGINDSVKIPPIRGQLVDSTCYFSTDRIWFFTATQEEGKTINRAYLLDENGTLLGFAEARADDGSWLETIRGKCAAKDFLLAPTDEGVVRVRLSGGTLVPDKEYRETSRFVDAASQLFLGNEGLQVIRRNSIWRLSLGSP